MRRVRAALVGSALLSALLASACAATRFPVSTDPGVPLAGYQAIHTQVTSSCRGVRTFTAELALAGRVGGERLRGRVVSGFARPDAIRLEGIAPFGPPAFVLAGREGVASLVLPRENAAVREASPSAVIEALLGVALEPADLQAVVTGCGVPDAVATGGMQHPGGWATVTLFGNDALFLHQDDGAWRVRGARRGEWTIEYRAWQGSFPAVVHLRSSPDAAVAIDLTATLSQIEANIEIDPSAFQLAIPPGSRAITVDALRSSGPLRGQP